MSRLLAAPLAASVVAFVAACGEEGAVKSRVEELRVLAIRAEPPEVQPGASTELRALVADPFGNGRPVTWAWAVCTPDPYEGESSCAEEGRTVPLTLGTAATLAVPPDVLDGLDPEAQERGIDLFVVLSVEASAVSDAAPDEREIAFKRVRVSTDPLPNRNPVLVSATFAGPVIAGEEVVLDAAASADSAETFESPNGPRTEDVRFSWFTTAGDLERSATFGDPVTTSNTWIAARPARLWIVLRDARGGSTWTVIDVPP